MYRLEYYQLGDQENRCFFPEFVNSIEDVSNYIRNNIELIIDYIRNHKILLHRKDCYTVNINRSITIKSGNRFECKLPRYFIKFKRAVDGVSKYYSVLPSEHYINRVRSQSRSYKHLGEIYDWIKRYITNRPHEIFRYRSEITVWPIDGDPININNHIKLISDGKVMNDLSSSNHFGTFLSEIERGNREYHTIYANKYQITDHITNIGLSNFELSEYYPSAYKGSIPQYIKIIFDFPDYVQTFRSLLLILKRSNLYLPFEILSLIMSKI